MSLLDQLWDDTVAGPRPDKGLGKLRKQSTFSFRSSDSGKESPPVTNTAVEDPMMRVTRSIMIVKPERTLSDTPPASPAGSTTPASPFPGKAVRFYHLPEIVLPAAVIETDPGPQGNRNKGNLVFSTAFDNFL